MWPNQNPQQQANPFIPTMQNASVQQAQVANMLKSKPPVSMPQMQMPHASMGGGGMQSLGAMFNQLNKQPNSSGTSSSFFPSSQFMDSNSPIGI